jgi:hypothetical protein
MTAHELQAHLWCRVYHRTIQPLSHAYDIDDGTLLMAKQGGHSPPAVHMYPAQHDKELLPQRLPSVVVWCPACCIPMLRYACYDPGWLGYGTVLLLRLLAAGTAACVQVHPSMELQLPAELVVLLHAPVAGESQLCCSCLTWASVALSVKIVCAVNALCGAAKLVCSIVWQW